MPIVDFVEGVYTPIVKSHSNEMNYFEFEANISSIDRFRITELYAPLFKIGLKSAKFGNRQSYENLIVDDKVPKKFLFDLERIKYGISIGRLPDPDDLPILLRKKLWLT